MKELVERLSAKVNSRLGTDRRLAGVRVSQADGYTVDIGDARDLNRAITRALEVVMKRWEAKPRFRPRRAAMFFTASPRRNTPEWSKLVRPAIRPSGHWECVRIDVSPDDILAAASAATLEHIAASLQARVKQLEMRAAQLRAATQTIPAPPLTEPDVSISEEV